MRKELKKMIYNSPKYNELADGWTFPEGNAVWTKNGNLSETEAMAELGSWLLSDRRRREDIMTLLAQFDSLTKKPFKAEESPFCGSRLGHWEKCGIVKVVGYEEKWFKFDEDTMKRYEVNIYEIDTTKEEILKFLANSSIRYDLASVLGE